MLNLIRTLIGFNTAIAGKIRAIQAFDEALALHGAKNHKKAFPLMLEAAEI